MNYVVKVVKDKVLKGKYWGMNYQANKELGENIPIKKNEILVSEKAKGRFRRQVTAHEKIEEYQMRHNGYKYCKAHAMAEAMDKHVK